MYQCGTQQWLLHGKGARLPCRVVTTSKKKQGSFEHCFFKLNTQLAVINSNTLIKLYNILALQKAIKGGQDNKRKYNSACHTAY